jgi:hypothetical protein
LRAGGEALTFVGGISFRARKDFPIAMEATRQTRSGLTGWVLAIARGIATDNEGVADVLREVGMDPAQLEGGYNRYSQEQITRLWQHAVERTGGADLGLRVAAQVRPSTFHVVGYAMSCSATLLRALRRFAFYCRLISDSATATLTETADHVQLQFYLDTGETPPSYQTVETVLASVLAFLRWIAGDARRDSAARGAGQQRCAAGLLWRPGAPWPATQQHHLSPVRP